MGQVQELSDARFQEDVLRASTPVLLDFWAPWCGPCKMIAPVVEEIAVENAGKVKVFKINIDDNPETAQNYGISSIPTLMVFNKGEVVTSLIGVQPKHKLQAALDACK